MGAGPDGLDQSWGYADPKQAAAAGIKVVSMYLSHDPSKNVTAAKVKAYHAAGIGVLLNWESEPGRPLLGKAAGKPDATAAVALVAALIKAVGYAPRSKLAIPFSCDRDVTRSQMPNVRDYYGATKKVDVIEDLHRQGLTVMEWQTYAWSGGRLSPEADFYQYLNGQHLAGASVDFNRIVHAEQLGAWWPPGHRLDSSSEHPLEDEAMTPDDRKYIDGQFKDLHDYVRAMFLIDTDSDGKKDVQVSADTIVGRRTGPILTAATSGQRLVTELGTRVAQLQAKQDADAKAASAQIAALSAQIADLASGKLNVSGSIPATLTYGTPQ
jgi:hypothetical protein